MKKVCRYVYSELLSHMVYEGNARDKWSILGMHLTDVQWKRMYKQPFIATTESKLRSFQFQIFNRSLVTNKFLHMCKIKDNALCYFCDKNVETIDHLLFECDAVQLFWKNMAARLGIDVNTYIVEKSVLLGIEKDENQILLNFIFMLGKCYIYVTKCLKRRLCVEQFIKTLVDHANLEHYIANLNGRIRKWENKWKIVKNLME